MRAAKTTSVLAVVALSLLGSQAAEPVAAQSTMSGTTSSVPFRGVQINTDQFGQDITGDAANEPTLAISPVDPNVLVVGWRQFPTIASDSRYAGFGYSHDGGRTWVNGGQLFAPPGEPVDAEQSDPVLAVDSAGTFYYWSEVFRPSPPPTRHNVYRSLDGGTSWEVPTLVQDPSTAGDKEWMVIDRTGGIGDGHIYGGWNNFGLGGQSFVRSTDAGNSFSAPIRIADAGGTQWMLHYAVGPDGELYAAWRNMTDNAIYITKSTNARDPFAVPTFAAFGSGGHNGIDIEIDEGNDPGFLNINPVGFHQIYLDVDRTDGPRRGWVYCLWADSRDDVCDIFFARSEDGGFTWITGIRVNDDPVGNGAYQWMPAMSVAPDGRTDAVWYDTRNHLGGPPAHSQLFYSFSVDGGTTWLPSRRVSDGFDTTVGYPVQQKIGDYIQCKSDRLGVHVAYAATFTGGQDIYYLRASVYDADGDGDVDLTDLAEFLDCLTGPDGGPVSSECRWADPDGDADVDVNDFARFQQGFTG